MTSGENERAPDQPSAIPRFRELRSWIFCANGFGYRFNDRFFAQLASSTAGGSWSRSVDEFRTAVNSCLEEWMTAPTWGASNADWKALRNWLADRAPDGEAEPVTYQLAEPPDDFGGGDPETGKELFNESCAGCHGTNGRGSSKAIPLAGKRFRPSYVAARVRNQLYGAKSHGNDTSGYPISRDLVRGEPYQGERLVVTLPEGKTLDDLGGVSVWCIDVGVDFGSGKFTAP